MWWQIPLVLVSWAVVFFMGYMYGETCGWLQHAAITRENAIPRCTECGDRIEEEDAAVLCTDCGGTARLTSTVGDEHGK